MSDHLESFLDVYGRDRSELLDAGTLSAPGLFSGEEEFLSFAERDYTEDRHFAFEIRPEETALIVVDLQEDFVNPAHPMCVPEAYRQIPRVNALIGACRAKGMPILFTEHSIAPDCSADFYRYWPPIAAGAIKEGQPGTKVYHGLDREPGDRVIGVKHTYDSFAGTDLDYVLRGQGIRTVIVCGTLTNFCCESTARTAYFLNYHVVFGSDVSATDSALAHTATLRTMRRGFARVLDGESIARCLDDGDRMHHEAVAARQLRSA
ncbi:MAG TPA: isochorismatase family cysteine hydrolase [Mycobacteriales bacterium]|jgi:nicotinamidase-related amidase|nr:isochorismatase family cysteine hydrolase [Mycobacteriales bacterium]